MATRCTQGPGSGSLDRADRPRKHIDHKIFLFSTLVQIGKQFCIFLGQDGRLARIRGLEASHRADGRIPSIQQHINCQNSAPKTSECIAQIPMFPQLSHRRHRGAMVLNSLHGLWNADVHENRGLSIHRDRKSSSLQIKSAANNKTHCRS